MKSIEWSECRRSKRSINKALPMYSSIVHNTLIFFHTKSIRSTTVILFYIAYVQRYKARHIMTSAFLALFRLIMKDVSIECLIIIIIIKKNEFIIVFTAPNPFKS